MTAHVLTLTRSSADADRTARRV